MIHKTDIFAAPTICGAALALALAAGCSKQSVQSQSESSFPEDRIIRVSPEVVTTKGTYTTDNLTKFDLLVEDSNNLTSKYTYNLTVGKDKVEAGDITVSEWGSTVDLNGEGGEQDAHPLRSLNLPKRVVQNEIISMYTLK